MILWEKRLVFIHVPKTGGSAILYALTNDSVCFDHVRGSPNHIAIVKKHMHGTFEAVGVGRAVHIHGKNLYSLPFGEIHGNFFTGCIVIDSGWRTGVYHLTWMTWRPTCWD